MLRPAPAGRRRSRRARPCAGRNRSSGWAACASRPSALTNSAIPPIFAGLNRDAAQRRLACQQGLDLLLALLGLERADAIDDPAAGPGQRGGAVEQAVLQGGELRDVGFAASARRRRDGGGSCRSRSTAHRPARHRTARPAIRSRRRRPSRRARPSRREVLAHAHQPVGRAVDRGHRARRLARAGRSCRRARRKDRRRACRRCRRAGAPAARRRRPAPTRRLRGSRAAARPGPARPCARCRSAARAPRSRCAQLSASALTVRSSGGSCPCAIAIARAVVSP